MTTTRYMFIAMKKIHEIGWQRGSHTENEAPPVKGLCCQPVSGNLVVCAATAGFSATMALGGRIRKPATSWHPT